MTRRDAQGPRWRAILRRRPAEAARPTTGPQPQTQSQSQSQSQPRSPEPRTSGAAAMRRFRIKDQQRVTVWSRRPLDTGDLLARLAPLCVGDAFIVADPDADPDWYCATISDTIAAFMIDATQNPLFGELPPALADTGWDATESTAYEISAAGDGPGGQRLRYRLAKALLQTGEGVLTDVDGERIDVESLTDATWGSLW